MRGNFLKRKQTCHAARDQFSFIESLFFDESSTHSPKVSDQKYMTYPLVVSS